jgi:hypothetical protein
VADEVVHVAADGTEVWRGGGFSEPASVSVNPNDGSCWVAEHGRGRVVHLASDGTLLSVSTDFYRPLYVSADPTDNSCWVAEQIASDFWNPGTLVHLGEDGRVLSRVGGLGQRAPVDVGDTDLSIWVADINNSQLVRFRVWFDDLPRSHWAFDAVLACVDAGVVAGYPDDTYRPSATVTRDQMAVYIARALAGGDDHVPDPAGDPTFPDVLTDFWAHKYVEHVAANSVVAGYDDGLYHPEYSVDRAQMAVYVARALEAPTGEAALADYVPSDPRNFPDVAESYWAYKHIEYCVENEVVQGYDDGHYHPYWLVTRDQMAVYVARAFGLAT